MAIVALIFGSVTGSIAAASSALVHGTDLIGTLSIYYSVALMMSLAIIATRASIPQRQDLPRANP